MDLIQAVVLALVQGLTEFLPVSSSAHLLLVPIFADWPDQGLAFDVALHVGSLAAVVIYFWQDIKRMFVAWFASLTRGESSEDSRLAWAVIFATIPVCIAGFFLKDLVATAMRSPLVSAFGLIGNQRAGARTGGGGLDRNDRRNPGIGNQRLFVYLLFSGVYQSDRYATFCCVSHSLGNFVDCALLESSGITYQTNLTTLVSFSRLLPAAASASR